MKFDYKNILKEYRSFILFLLLMFVFRSAVADWNHIPTGSMKPTILVGDRILVNKMAYDIRIPFTNFSLFKLADPDRGDIVVFDSKASGKKLVKRIIGIPGDVISMKNNVIFINGRQLDYHRSDYEKLIMIEDLGSMKYYIRINPRGSRLSSFKLLKVPEQQYLVLGDNRDNSADSRVIGFIPRHEILGRTRKVVMSFNYDNYYIPRSNRFFHTL